MSALTHSYEREFGSRAAFALWIRNIGAKYARYELTVDAETFRIHVAPVELRS